MLANSIPGCGVSLTVRRWNSRTDFRGCGTIKRSRRAFEPHRGLLYGRCKLTRHRRASPADELSTNLLSATRTLFDDCRHREIREWRALSAGLRPDLPTIGRNHAISSRTSRRSQCWSIVAPSSKGRGVFSTSHGVRDHHVSSPT